MAIKKKELKEEWLKKSYIELKNYVEYANEEISRFKEFIIDESNRILNLDTEDKHYTGKLDDLISSLKFDKDQIKFWEDTLEVLNPILKSKENEELSKSEYENYVLHNKPNIDILVNKVNEMQEDYINRNTDTDLTDEFIISIHQNMLKELIWMLKDNIGNITEIYNIDYNEKGGFDGIFKGDKGMVIINTILAGGYNIQCLHYRTLVRWC